MNCIYLREQKVGKQVQGRDVYGCYVHESCVESGGGAEIVSCEACRERLNAEDESFSDKFLDPLWVIDRTKRPTLALRNLLAGGPAFLVCGGPSTNQEPLELLNRRGCWSLCVNNVAGHGRFVPQAFICSDPPSKFHDGFWVDPKVMKFVPSPKLHNKRGKLRRKIKDKEFGLLQKEDGGNKTTLDTPNTWGYGRRSWLKPDDSFFIHEHAAWGNLNSGVERTGEEKTVCTMLLGMRLLYYLGARTIFLVGVDFFMNPAKGNTGNYSFAEVKEEGACRSNNRQFGVVNEWLCKMQQDGVFDRFGVSFYNCFSHSGLRAFSYVPFVDAVSVARKDIPPEPFDLNGWYYKPPKPPKKKRRQK